MPLGGVGLTDRHLIVRQGYLYAYAVGNCNERPLTLLKTMLSIDLSIFWPLRRTSMERQVPDEQTCRDPFPSNILPLWSEAAVPTMFRRALAKTRVSIRWNDP